MEHKKVKQACILLAPEEKERRVNRKTAAGILEGGEMDPMRSVGTKLI